MKTFWNALRLPRETPTQIVMKIYVEGNENYEKFRKDP